MKRFSILLLLLLLLTGCAVQEQPDSTTLSTEVTEPPVSSLLDKAAPLFQATGGAISTYRIDGMSFDDLVPMGDGLLAFHGGDATTLYLLAGEPLEIAATATLSGFYSPTDLLQLSSSGLAIYESDSRSILFLDGMLKETRTLQLPKNAVGDPAVSKDLNTVYFCTADCIQAMDLLTGILRPLQENNFADAQGITGILFDGTYLRHEATLANGKTVTTVVNAQTGQAVYTGAGAADIVTGRNHYFLTVDSGSTNQLVFGSLDSTPGVLWPAEAITDFAPLPQQNALVAIYSTEDSCRLAYYDLTSGKHTADVTLPGIAQVHNICAGAAGTVWFCAYDEATQVSILHHWDTSLSSTGNETVYTDTYYTRSAPDTEGLAALEARLSELETGLGIDIILGEAAAQVQPWEGSFTTEYLVPVYEAWLPKLEAALQQFPEGFLSATVSDGLHIVLVRSIHGRVENGYSDEVSGIQYWHGTGTYISLSLGDDPAQTLYHNLGYLIDTRVLTLCTAYKNWDDLNPQGFRYDNSYITNKFRQDWQYLQDSNRSFIDMFSMSFAREDRAQIFEYAMTSGNEAFFQSNTMQRKLKTVCDGIREAYGLTKDSRVFPWEHYLLDT